MFAVVSEVLAHGASGVRSQVLQGSGIRCGSRHHDSVFHGIGICQPLHQLGHGGSLLTDGYVDAVQFLLLLCALVEALLVDDGVDGNGGFAAREITCLHYKQMLEPSLYKAAVFSILPSLSVTNDQLSLSTTNGHQTVHGFDTGLHGLPHGDTGDDARGLQTHTSTLLGTQGALMLKVTSK